LDVVKFLHKNRSEGCTMAAIETANSFGYMDIVKFLRGNIKDV